MKVFSPVEVQVGGRLAREPAIADTDSASTTPATSAGIPLTIQPGTVAGQLQDACCYLRRVNSGYSKKWRR